MWPPTNVVGEHKRRANFIWVSLVMLIIGYSLWLIISTYQKRKNPTVNISIEDDRYAYPTITICATGGTAVGYGCDTVYYEYSCSSTIESYISNLGGFENINGEGYLQNDVNENEAYPYECVDLDLSDMSEVEGYTGLLPVGMGIWAQWDLNSDDADGTLENSEGAFVFFTDPDVPDPLGSHNMSTTFVGIIPFTRQLAGDIPDNFIQTDITMKLTESMKLDGTNVKTYSAGTISSKEYLIPNWWIQDYYQDRAVMFMQIWQPGLSHTVRKEIDPLEWAEIVGNLGGAWEIILIMWGIFFIAKKRDEPELKGRDLVKTVQKGAQDVVRSASMIASRLNTKQGSGDSLPSERKEATPTWDKSTDQGHRPPPAYDFSSDQNFAAGGTQYSRPTVDDFPRRACKPF